MLRSKKILAAILPLLTASGIHAQGLEYRVTLGARAAALGESGIALPPDALGSYALSTYYNPAALGFMIQGESLVDYSNLFGANVYESVVALASPLPYVRNREFGLGLMANFEGFDDGDLRSGRYIFSLASGFALHRNLALGAGFKAVVLNTQFKNADIASSSGTGHGLDLSLHAQFPFRTTSWVRQIDLAVAAYDLYHTRVEFDASLDTLFTRAVRAGAAVQLRDWRGVLHNPTLLAQFDDRWHVGAEAAFVKLPEVTLALRAGYGRDFGEPNEAAWSFGFGLNTDESAARVRFDYAYLHPTGILPARHVFTISAPMWKGPPPLLLMPSSFAPIYASFYQAYARHIRAEENSIRVKNLTSKPITGKFEKLDGIAGLALDPNANREITILPDSMKTVRLHFKFSDTILEHEGTPRFKEAELVFQITSATGNAKSIKQRLPLLVAGRNYLEWDLIAREAAFITPADKLVQSFRARISAPEDSFWENYRAIFRAAQFYEALPANGFTYEKDTRYRIDSLLAAKGLDHVRYPAELLNADASARKGDCDDLVALYCSLLESDNIATALVATRDHIFMLFDTGIHVSRRALLPLPEASVLSFPRSKDAGLKHSLWLPVEVTAIKQKLPFDGAVALGARFFHEHERDSVFAIVSTQTAQELFPPADRESKNPATEFKSAEEAAQRSLARLLPKEKILARVRDLAAKTSKRGVVDFDSTLQAATLAAFWDDLDAAQGLLAQLRARKEFAQRYELLNNLGNVEFLRGQYEKAAQAYGAALALRPDFVQGYVNRILLHSTWSEQEPGLAKRFARIIRSDSAAVDSLYQFEQRQAAALSLAEMQGVFLSEASGLAGQIDTLKVAKSDSAKAKRASPKISANILKRVGKMLQRLSYAFDPSDPQRRRTGGGVGEPVLESKRLVNLLHWRSTHTSAFAQGF